MTSAQNPKMAEIILNECCFISGGRRSGKTNLGIVLVDQLLENDVKVKVIDGSRQWLTRSSVPYYLKVARTTVGSYRLFTIRNLPNVWNCIYDCSMLTTTELREFVQRIMQCDFEEAVNLDEQGIKLKTVTS